MKNDSWKTGPEKSTQITGKVPGGFSRIRVTGTDTTFKIGISTINS
ncbi:hypothetical protein [uncultured Methanolobus sp.]|nr:hypothetical protein [uncultured Methanolobus sp.]